MLLTQLCPTRMRLLLDPEASVLAYLEPSYGRGGGGGSGYGYAAIDRSPLLNIISLSRFASLVVSSWGREGVQKGRKGLSCPVLSKSQSCYCLV